MTTHMQTRGFGRVDALLRVTSLTVITLGLGLVFTQVRGFAALPTAKPENANVVLGRQAIDAKDFKSAVGILTKAVQENPNDADAHTMLGYSYRKLGTFDKSIDHYQTALKIDSNHRSAREYLGELYLEMKQPANAEKQLEALKKACPFFWQMRGIRRSEESSREVQNNEHISRTLLALQASPVETRKGITLRCRSVSRGRRSRITGLFKTLSGSYEPERKFEDSGNNFSDERVIRS